MSAPKKDYIAQFAELAEKEIDLQGEFFLKSFIFELENDWKDVPDLMKRFKKALSDADEGKDDLNPIMAADFLQKNGHERTALERKEEVKDIDLDNNGRIAFIEYLLLHYKVMVLKSYYKRKETSCPHDLSRGGIGVTGVGEVLLEELFTMPEGLDPELEAAIEEFTAKKKAEEAKLKALEEKVAAGGVKGMAAANEIKQIQSQDKTDMNRIELTLNAAKKRASKQSGTAALEKKKAAEEAAEREKRESGRNKLKNMAAMWENK